jgi:catechol 2,3-dioxygenase-like lactoylglutathione lyase family enzyme
MVSNAVSPLHRVGAVPPPRGRGVPAGARVTWRTHGNRLFHGDDMAFAHLTLATRDIDRAAAFFTAALGWRALDRPNNIGRPAAWLEIAPGQELHLVQVADFVPSSFEAEFGRHVALALPLADFDGLKRRLLANGATLIDPERPTPFSRFFFRSPDGYVFEIVAAERQPEFGAGGSALA